MGGNLEWDHILSIRVHSTQVYVVFVDNVQLLNTYTLLLMQIPFHPTDWFKRVSTWNKVTILLSSHLQTILS
jgi:hypothetical protein